MKKVLITGATFTGSIELLFGESIDSAQDDSGVRPGETPMPPLMVVDFRCAVIDDNRKRKFMGYLPARLEPGFEQSWGLASGLQFTICDAEIAFDDFWWPYGKTAHKERAVKEWNHITKHERALALSKLPAYLRYLSRTGIGKADAHNYLKKKYWTTDWDNVNA